MNLSKYWGRTALIYAGALLPPLFILALIYLYGVNLPYADEWDDIPVVVKAYEGSRDFASLWAQRNEHRIVTVYLVTLLLANLTSYNVIAQMYAGWAIQLLCLFFVWRLLNLTLGHTLPRLIPWLTLTASALMFSPLYAENWIWGLGSVQWFLTNLFAVLSVWALARWPGRWVGPVVAPVMATLGMLTMGNGLSIWAVGLVGIIVLGLPRNRRAGWAQAACWIVAAAASGVVYSIGYNKPGHHPSALSFLSHPLEFIEYILIYIGTPFGTLPGQYTSCLVAGLLGFAAMAAAVYWVVRRLPGVVDAIVPWLLLVLYATLSATMTAVGRVGFSMLQATESRYRSIALVFWVCLSIILGVTLAEAYRRGHYRMRPRAWLIASPVAAVLLGSYAVVSSVGFERIQWHSLKLKSMLPYVYHYNDAPAKIFQAVYPNDTWVRHQSGQMAALGLGPFAKDGPLNLAGIASSEISSEGVHDETGCDVIKGWAWDRNPPDTPISVDIYDGSTLLGTVPANIFRQDLADAGKGNGAHGFVYTVPPGLKDGQPHAIVVKISQTRKLLFNTPMELRCAR